MAETWATISATTDSNAESLTNSTAFRTQGYPPERSLPLRLQAHIPAFEGRRYAGPDLYVPDLDATTEQITEL